MEKYVWIVTAVIAWIVFFLLIDWSRIKYTIWGGFIMSGIQLFVDVAGDKLDLYHATKIFHVFSSDAFFTLGIIFVTGVLFAQSLPRSRRLQLANILVLTTLFGLEEFLFVKIGALHYKDSYIWVYSSFIDFAIFISFTWIVEFLGLNRLGRKL